MFYIILIIACIILFFWVKNKVFSSNEERRINMHNQLREENKQLYNEYKEQNKDK